MFDINSDIENLEKQLHQMKEHINTLSILNLNTDMRPGTIQSTDVSWKTFINDVGFMPQKYDLSCIEKFKNKIDSMKSFSVINDQTLDEVEIALNNLKNEIDIENKDQKKEIATVTKPLKLLISHSSKDTEYVKEIVDLLERIGMDENNMICSSLSDYPIPLGENIYDWLREQIGNCYVLFILSDNYYQSVACLNEMGAAWMAQSKYNTILLPGFEDNKIKGVIDKAKIYISFDDADLLKKRLGELKESLQSEFELKAVSPERWERYRDTFIENIRKGSGK